MLALVFAAAPPPTLAAGPTPLIIGGGVKATAGGTATGFEMVVSSDTNMSCVGTGLGAALQLNGGSQTAPTTVTGDGTQTVTFTWTLAIASGNNVAAAFVCTEVNENSFTVNAYFTPKANSTTTPSTGWKVTEPGVVYLTNDHPAVVDFSDLKFQRPTSITASSLLTLVTGASTGSLAATNSGKVPVGSPTVPGDLKVDDPLLQSGTFLTGRADTSFDDPTYSVLTATVVMAHQQEGVLVGGVAELPDSNAALPASAQSSGSSTPLYALFAGIALVAAGAAGAGWYLKRRRLS
jgi:hypothetical protein